MVTLLSYKIEQTPAYLCGAVVDKIDEYERLVD